jgi:DNA-binding NtrC family response regulator
LTRRLIIIGDPAASLRHTLCDPISTSELSCGFAAWDEASRLNSLEAEMVIFFGVSASDKITPIFQSLRRNPIDRPTMAILAEGADSSLIALVTESVDDFMLAPIRGDELLIRIRRILGAEQNSVDSVATRLLNEVTVAGLVGRDPAFLKTVARIPLGARTDNPVLIAGETGTGKELVARAIHSFSPRRDQAFIPVDCASIPDHLFENEMFGHVRGAFTDARADQQGLAGMARGGTLFLDEIDSLSIGAQSKLLRFLQERTYRPLGSDRFQRADVKLLTATNKDLDGMAKSGRFRSDLLFRIDVVRMDLAPLRSRPADIALLAQHFVRKACAENGFARKTLTTGALRKLEEYRWPGNIRELHNVIQRAVLFSEDGWISLSEFHGAPGDEPSPPSERSFREARAKALESFERRYVRDLMRECNGNVSKAARLAQKERRSFGRLVKRYRIREDSVPAMRVAAGSA